MTHPSMHPHAHKCIHNTCQWKYGVPLPYLSYSFYVRLPQPCLQTPRAPRPNRRPPAGLSNLHPVQSTRSLRSASRCSPSSPAQLALRTPLLLRLQSPPPPPDPRQLGTLAAAPHAVGTSVSLASDPCVAPTGRCTRTSAS